MKKWLFLAVLGLWMLLSGSAEAACWTSAGKDCSQETASAHRVSPAVFTYRGNMTADTQIKSGAGVLHTMVCNSDAAATAGSITLYDNTAESGTVIHSITVGTGFYPPATMVFDVEFSTGLYLGFTTTADVTCSVSYR